MRQVFEVQVSVLGRYMREKQKERVNKLRKRNSFFFFNVITFCFLLPTFLYIFFWMMEYACVFSLEIKFFLLYMIYIIYLFIYLWLEKKRKKVSQLFFLKDWYSFFFNFCLTNFNLLSLSSWSYVFKKGVNVVTLFQI